jgi:hypothetical protein
MIRNCGLVKWLVENRARNTELAGHRGLSEATGARPEWAQANWSGQQEITTAIRFQKDTLHDSTSTICQQSKHQPWLLASL